MPLDATITTNVLARTIARDKAQSFREHPRSVSFRFDSKWYLGVRVAQFSQDLEMMRFAFNPDTDTVLKINFQSFIDEAGAGVVAPEVNARIRMDNIDWRVEEKVVEADDCKLFLRKEVVAV